MTVCTVNHLPAATHGETARCLFSIELSKQSWVIGFITPLSAKINRRILSGGDWRGLLELIEEMRARASRETGRAGATKSDSAKADLCCVATKKTPSDKHSGGS